MKKRLFIFLIALSPFVCPGAALADLNGAPTLAANQTLNLDTGAVAASGGDILWSGSSIQFQGSATGLDFSILGITGNLGYDFLETGGSAGLSSFQSSFAATALVSRGSFAGHVIGIYTNGGHFAVFLVTAQNQSSIILQFVTFGAATPAGPVISQVMNNYSLIPAGLPNSGIAPGSLFIIQGSSLASATTATTLQSSAAGLPTSLNGASVRITDANGATSSPAFYYAIASQLALVMPSSVAIGSATVTVTYNGQTSAPYTIQIVASSMGFASYYGSGTGLGIAQDAVTGALFNFSNPIPPGASVVLWGSGLGADPVRDTTYAPASFNINNLSQVYIGGVPALIQYQGASGYPGLNQINIAIPQNAPTGCFVPLTGVTAGGIPTNSVVLPIGNTICAEPALGFDSSTLAHLSGQKNVNVAALEIEYVTQPDPSGSGSQTTQGAVATFQQAPGSNYGTGAGVVSIGGCILDNLSFSSSSTTADFQGLNAGVITLSSPNAFQKPVALLRSTQLPPGVYEASLPSGFVSTSGGTFTFTGAAGSDIGPFTANVTFSNPLLTWTNQPAFVPRSAGMPVTWTGGDAGSLVTISGTTYGAGSTAGFLCAADAAAGQFTIPSWILAAFPSGVGYLTVTNQTAFQPFSVAGADRAYARGLVVDEIITVYQ